MSAACLRLEKSEEEKEELRRKIEEFDVRCEELLMELPEVREELKKEQRRDQNLEMEAKILARQNIDLRKYLDHLEEQVVCINCSGNLSNCSKHIHEVGERHKSRKLKLLRTRAEKALWFVESFGATLDPSVIDRQRHTLHLPLGKNCNQNSVFNQPSEMEKDQIRATLYTMDRFCVSDAAYHEFAMTINGLERSYLVKRCRNELNKIIPISRTPGKEPGVQMSFKEELTYQLRQVRVDML